LCPQSDPSPNVLAQKPDLLAGLAPSLFLMNNMIHMFITLLTGFMIRPADPATYIFLFTKAKKDRRRKNSVEIIGEKEKKKNYSSKKSSREN